MSIQTRICGLLMFAAALRTIPGAAPHPTEAVPEKENPAVLQTVFVQPEEEPALALVRRAVTMSPHPWREAELRGVAAAIDQSAARLNLPALDLVAMIGVESHFRPQAFNRNRNGTVDLGLTQQNSRYVQGRCRQSYGRNCTRAELENPLVSIELMTVTLARCGRVFRNVDARLTCYNSWRRAFAYSRSGRAPPYLRKVRAMRTRLATTKI